MRKSMNIRGVSAVLFCALLFLAGCGQKSKSPEAAGSGEISRYTEAVTESSAEPETTPGGLSDTETIVMETLPEAEETSDAENPEGRFSAEGAAFLSSLESYDITKWLEEDMDESWTELFEAYNGEQIQRYCVKGDDDYSPAVCPDVIFYRPEQGESPEAIVKKMVDAMLQPLTKPSETRPFTITDYKIADQELIPLEDHVWILPAIEGYYSYEGVDLISMDEYAAAEPDLEQDGMMPFMKQAGDSEFVLILMELDGVYRLQRAQNMISE
ncbi:MAG: hypothetical protein ACI4D3_05950 [Lachnospiraceae bacterium]